MYKKTIASIFFLASLFIAVAATAQDSIEGKYTEIKPAQPTQTGDKIEVIEVFWYGCPHCYTFEPYVEAWLEDLPDDVEFIRLPGVLNQQWIPHAKAYYTAQKLGIVDNIHRALFDALHKEKQRLYTDDQLMVFFSEHGVSSDEFSRIYNSKEVDTKIRQAYFAARDYKITGVPTMVVNGKYSTTGSLTKTYDVMIDVVNALIERER
jgi:thiol:disulfide interchange protein DsbA